MHYDRLESDSDERKKENGIEIEDVPMDPYIKSDISRFTWNGCLHACPRARARARACARIGRGVYRAFHSRRNRSNYTCIGYVITQKIFIGTYSSFSIRTSVSRLHFKGNFRNPDPD